MKTQRRTLIQFLTIAFWAAFSGTTLADNTKPPAQLLLVISVDQMRYDYLERFAPLFKYGFKTLLQKGAIFSEARYRHASTETGPGHAVILSGRHGSHSGIIANSWYDSSLKKMVNVVDDPLQKPVGGKGRSASPAHFNGYMLGDALKMKTSATKVVGVSAKDRGAILLAGKNADAAFWFEKEEGKYITSTYYMKQAPQWLDAWNSKRYADQFFQKSWTRLDSNTKLYENYAGPDAVMGERDKKNFTFPHLIKGEKKDASFYGDFLITPFADDMTLDFALAARKVYQLGEDSTPDILAVSFSATDYIGHNYGPNSQEMMDQMLRLDQLLGRLFSVIDMAIGLNKTLVVLTSDHGVLPLVENLHYEFPGAKRLKPEVFDKPVEAALKKRFHNPDGFIAQSGATDFWLDKEKIRLAGAQLQDVESEIVQALKSTGYIHNVYTKSDFFKDPPKNDPFFSLFQNSFFALRSPDIIGNVNPNILVDFQGYGGGTSHGTPYDYDRHVPIIFMGPAIRPGTYTKPCGPEDIAPTLAFMLNVEFPKEDDSRLLLEIFKP